MSADGSVHTIFNGGEESPTYVNGPASTGANLSIAADDASIRYYASDHLGTAQMELSAGGWPVSKSEFAPFGQELSDPSITTNRYKFTGKERDAESGLDYFGARYYASTVGRWMSPDWSPEVEAIPFAILTAPQTLNLYSYVLNNPLSKDDPDGHASLQYERAKAIRLAWEQGRSLVQRTGTGTRPWTAAERAELLKTGRVSGYQGHHINSVNGHRELAGEPNNVKFVEGVEGNLAEHGGNFRNVTNGELLSRSLIALQVTDIALNVIRGSVEESITGIHEGIAGGLSLADPSKAATTLDSLYIHTYCKA
ncbi:MAG: hypothetical protein JSS87_02210 [Acidobacteria bacterium]|nr:hypothetical protein [Acidobacteriota bacterium]